MPASFSAFCLITRLTRAGLLATSSWAAVREGEARRMAPGNTGSEGSSYSSKTLLVAW